jgi:hypothetical protein
MLRRHVSFAGSLACLSWWTFGFISCCLGTSKWTPSAGTGLFFLVVLEEFVQMPLANRGQPFVQMPLASQMFLLQLIHVRNCDCEESALTISILP